MAFNPHRMKTAAPKFTMRLASKQFNAFLKRFSKSLSEPQAAAALLKIAFDATTLIAKKTPVDTGRARAAWYPALNAISRKTGIPNSLRPSGKAQGEGYAKGSVSMKLRGLKKTVVIKNAVEYIRSLEFGWSTQAPHGMVRVTLGIISRQMHNSLFKQLEAMWKENGVAKWSHWRASASGPTFGGR
jgi:hypothetical protein